MTKTYVFVDSHTENHTIALPIIVEFVWWANGQRWTVATMRFVTHKKKISKNEKRKTKQEKK